MSCGPLGLIASAAWEPVQPFRFHTYIMYASNPQRHRCMIPASIRILRTHRTHRTHRISSATHNGIGVHTPSQLPQPQRPMRFHHNGKRISNACHPHPRATHAVQRVFPHSLLCGYPHPYATYATRTHPAASIRTRPDPPATDNALWKKLHHLSLSSRPTRSMPFSLRT